MLLAIIRGLYDLDLAGLNDKHAFARRTLLDNDLTICIDFTKHTRGHDQDTFFHCKPRHALAAKLSTRLPMKPGCTAPMKISV